MTAFKFPSATFVDRIHIVDYQTCDICGFRLMRVESASGQSAPTVIHCSICGMHKDENGITRGKKLAEEERLTAFDNWLADHGLTRATLEDTYCLRIESFFDFNQD
jgi:hypothetical protein